MPRGQAIRQRQQDVPQEKDQKQEHCKSKNQHRFPSRIGGGWSAEIAAFLLSSNIEIRRAKFFSRGRNKIFFLKAKKIEGDIALIRLTAGQPLASGTSTSDAPHRPLILPGRKT